MRSPEINIYDDHELTSLAAAKRVAKLATERQCQWFDMAVSGGSTPRRFFELLAGMDDFPWYAVRVFWVDERCVAPGEKGCNYSSFLDTFPGRLLLEGHQIYRMPGELGAMEGALEYQRMMQDVLCGSGPLPNLDLVLLGMGSDGHTASLFPDHVALEEEVSWVVPVVGGPGNPPVDRISLSLPLINAARTAVFLVTGDGKQDMVRRVLNGEDKSVPASLVKAQQVIWMLDQAAAGGKKAG